LQRPKIFPKVGVVEWLSAILTDQVTFAICHVSPLSPIQLDVLGELRV